MSLQPFQHVPPTVSTCPSNRRWHLKDTRPHQPVRATIQSNRRQSRSNPRHFSQRNAPGSASRLCRKTWWERDEKTARVCDATGILCISSSNSAHQRRRPRQLLLAMRPACRSR